MVDLGSSTVSLTYLAMLMTLITYCIARRSVTRTSRAQQASQHRWLPSLPRQNGTTLPPWAT
jgi:heme exporter protein D